jgi:hypothetical protein
MSEPIEIPMSSFNRILDPVLESTALMRVKKGMAVVIEDEPETREYKKYTSLLPFTMSDILATRVEQ